MPQSSDVDPSAEPVDELDAALAELGSKISGESSEDTSSESEAQEPDDQSPEKEDSGESEDTNSEEPVPGELVKAEPDEAGDSTTSDEEPKLSRRQRAKLYEQFKHQSEQERAENERLRQQLEVMQAEDHRRQAAIDKALGTNADYQKALEDVMSPDPKISEPAKKRYKIYSANREFYGQLLKGAERDINVRLAKEYWEASEERPGIDRKLVQSAPMKDVLLHYYDQGALFATAAAAEREEKLQKSIETLKAEVKELKSSKVTSRVSPITGGRPVTKDQTPLRGTLGPDGLPTDDAISAARNGRLDFLKS